MAAVRNMQPQNTQTKRKIRARFKDLDQLVSGCLVCVYFASFEVENYRDYGAGLFRVRMTFPRPAVA